MNEATEARDSAIDATEEHADEKWLGLAVRAIRYVARSHAYFTTDDVWDVLETYGISAPREPRAMAAAMRQAQLEGTIRATSDYRASGRVVSHARPKRLWASNLI